MTSIRPLRRCSGGRHCKQRLAILARVWSGRWEGAAPATSWTSEKSLARKCATLSRVAFNFAAIPMGLAPFQPRPRPRLRGPRDAFGTHPRPPTPEEGATLGGWARGAELGGLRAHAVYPGVSTTRSRSTWRPGVRADGAKARLGSRISRGFLPERASGLLPLLSNKVGGSTLNCALARAPTALPGARLHCALAYLERPEGNSKRDTFGTTPCLLPAPSHPATRTHTLPQAQAPFLPAPCPRVSPQAPLPLAPHPPTEKAAGNPGPPECRPPPVLLMGLQPGLNERMCLRDWSQNRSCLSILGYCRNPYFFRRKTL